MSMHREVGIGVIGMGWMGTDHTRAYAQVRHRYPNVPLRPVLVACADESQQRATAAKEAFGFKTATQNWQEVIAADDVEIVCITTPNHMHVEIVKAAAAANKAIMVEKPVGRSPLETAEAARAVVEAGVSSAVGFGYRWAPLTQYAMQLIASGKMGNIRQYRGRLFTNYGADPLGAFSWRFDQNYAGLGVTGDLLAHVLNMAFGFAGPIKRVFATNSTFIHQRPVPSQHGSHFAKGDTSAEMQSVTNEDSCSTIVEFESGADGVLETSRATHGVRCELKFEVYTDRGSLRWNFEDMNRLEVFEVDKGPDGYASVISGPEHPDHAHFSPGAGIGLGFADLKCIETAHFLDSYAKGEPFPLGITEALRVAEVTNAIMRSWESGQWEAVTPFL